MKPFFQVMFRSAPEGETGEPPRDTRTLAAALVSTLVLSSMLVAPDVDAQKCGALREFGEAPNSLYAPLVEWPDGLFYGVASQGGAFNGGTVFRLTAGGEIASLHDFRPEEGWGPMGGLAVGDDGALYGTTRGGGPENSGVVFRVTPQGDFRVLHGFAGPNVEGPSSRLVKDADGSFLGTIPGGEGSGTLFRITAAGDYQVIGRFGGSLGFDPRGDLFRASDGSVYGTTGAGGAEGNGTVYRLEPSGALRVVYDFRSEDGALPSGVVEGADGSLYGVMEQGGDSIWGSVFRITLGATPHLTTLHSFSGGDGWKPVASLLPVPGGALLGSTELGAGGAGTLFEVTPYGGYRTLHTFGTPDGRDGRRPVAPLILASNGRLYGTTVQGGDANRGTVYEMTRDGQVATLASFFGDLGSNPYGRLSRGSDGAFYGGTANGGTAGKGTIYRVDTAGRYRTLRSFDGPDGAGVLAALSDEIDGVFYGVAYSGGASSLGTVFRVDASGAFRLLHSFSGPDGAGPKGGLVKGPDGALYGTTTQGGDRNRGTVFRITRDGVLTTLHSLTDEDDRPLQTGLVLASDGNFYGTAYGSDGSAGSIFRVTPSGDMTTLHRFSGTDGGYPEAALVEGPDGLLYGTTSASSFALGSGVLFRISTSGAFSVVHQFDRISEGGSPGGLTVASDGNLYGTTDASVYRLGAPGDITILVRTGSCLAYGAQSLRSLTEGLDGRLYGPAPHDGLYYAGAIVRFSLPPTLASFFPSTGPTAGGSTVRLRGTFLQPGAAVSFGGSPATNVVVRNATTVTATIPAHGAGNVDVVVTNPDGQSATSPGGFTYAEGAPALTGVSPVVGPTTGGTLVSLTGSGFQVGATASFGPSPAAAVTYSGPAALVATTPSSSPGIVDVLVTNPDGGVALLPQAFSFEPPATATRWFPLTPCRLVDSRLEDGPRGGPQLGPGETRRFVARSACGVPNEASVLTVNYSVVGATAPGELRAFPGDSLWTGTSALSFSPSRIRTNNGFLKLAADSSGAFQVSNASQGSLHVIVDVSGYFR